jgi:hypothetical protein
MVKGVASKFSPGEWHGETTGGGELAVGYAETGVVRNTEQVARGLPAFLAWVGEVGEAGGGGGGGGAGERPQNHGPTN